MLVTQHEPRAPLSVAQTERLRDWLKPRMHEHWLHEIVTTFVYVLVTIAAHLAAIAFGIYLEWFFANVFGSRGAFFDWMWLIPICTLGAMYPLYFQRYRTSDATIKLSGGTLKVSQRSLDLPDVDVRESVDRMIFRRLKLEIFLFPLWCVSRVMMHAGYVHSLRHADSWVVARVLAHLLHENRRLQLHDLDAKLHEPGLPTAIHALETEPGVLFYTDDGLAIALNADLTRELLKTVEIADKG